MRICPSTLGHIRNTTYMQHYVYATLRTCNTTYTQHYVHAKLRTRNFSYMQYYVHATLRTRNTTYMQHYVHATLHTHNATYMSKQVHKATRRYISLNVIKTMTNCVGFCQFLFCLKLAKSLPPDLILLVRIKRLSNSSTNIRS